MIIIPEQNYVDNIQADTDVSFPENYASVDSVEPQVYMADANDLRAGKPIIRIIVILSVNGFGVSSNNNLIRVQ